MSINSIQLQEKTKELQARLLKMGVEPNNYELNKLLHEFFDSKTLGMPYYSPIQQKSHEVSSKEDYNHNFETFGQDIQNAYKADIQANNKAVAMCQYYDVEKENIKNALSRLALKVDGMAENLKASMVAQQYVEAFGDYYGLEHYGDKSRNIPYTTAFVDLLGKKAYIEKANPAVNKLPLNNASVSIEGLNKFIGYQTSGNVSDVLNDMTNDIYVISAERSDQSAMTISLIVDLGGLREINTVLFSFVSTNEMPCLLSLSDDGTNYVPAYSFTARDFIEWNFPSKRVTHVKIDCMKTEPDGVHQTENASRYEYYYLFKNISIALESFEEKALLVTKPIEFTNLASRITVNATDMVYPKTAIDYFIGFDNGTDKVGWDMVKNREPYDLFMFEKRHKIVNAHLEQFGHVSDGTELYKLYELPEGTNRNTLKVSPGYNMWSVRRYNRKAGDGLDKNFSLNSMDFTDHAEKCDVTQLFMDCENYKSFPIQSNVLYIFTQYVSMAEPGNLYAREFNVLSTDLSSKIAGAEKRLFINGYECGEVDGKYSFALKKGVSKVQLALYVPSNNAVNYALHHNLNFKQLANDAFAFPPMKYTNNDILDKRMAGTYSYYTIKDNFVCVNVNPSDMVKSDLEDMGYFISYTCLTEDMKQYFDGDKLRFRLMAVLSSSDPDLSPAVINFRITGV